MSIKDQLSSDIGLFFNLNEFAQSATYINAQGTNIGDFNIDIQESIYFDGSPKKVKGIGQISCKSSDIIPEINSTWVVGGTSWRVERQIRKEFGVIMVQVRKDARSKFR